MKLPHAVIAGLFLITLPLHAADLSDLTYTTTGSEVTITDCNTSASLELVIPDTIEGNPVTSIGFYAFGDCISLTNITIPDGVTSIENLGFHTCTGLTSITIGDSVISIGDYAFTKCEGLTSITIPDSVKSIGNGAFSDCPSLTSITIGNGVTSISYAAFSGCSALTAIEVGAGNVNYTEVNGVLFNKEKTLLHTYPAGKTGANYVIPDSVTSIGGSAFSNCTGLTSITIGNGVTRISYAAFEDCSSLTSIAIGDSVTGIGIYTFAGCISLTSITIGNGVTIIGDYAFIDCPSLTSITIPDSVTSIGEAAFAGCTSLRSITFIGTAPTVGANAFLGVADGAGAEVLPEFAASFGGLGSTWAGLIVIGTTRYIEATIITGSGSVAGGGTFIIGSSVTLTATPDTGYVFIGWSGDATGSANPLTLSIDRGTEVGAFFIELASHGLVTQASYDVVVAERNAAIAERDSRPTLAEVQDARVDSIVLAKDWQTNAVSLCFGLQKTDDFVSWTAFEGGTWSEAPNGEFKLTLPLGEAKKWLRLTLPE